MRRHRKLQCLLQSRDRPADRPSINRAGPGQAPAARVEIKKRRVEDNAKPLIFFTRGGVCWDPKVKYLTVTVNSIYNGWRMKTFGSITTNHRTRFSQVGAGEAGGVAPHRGGDGKSGQDADRSGRGGRGEPPVCRSVGKAAARCGGLGGRASGPSSGRAESAESLSTSRALEPRLDFGFSQSSATNRISSAPFTPHDPTLAVWRLRRGSNRRSLISVLSYHKRRFSQLLRVELA